MISNTSTRSRIANGISVVRATSRRFGVCLAVITTCCRFEPGMHSLRSATNLRKTEIDPQELARAIECVQFSNKVAEYQMRKGRFFYFEHPLTASSWSGVEESWELTQKPSVDCVVSHMCQVEFGAEDSEGIGLVTKPTKIVTSMPSIASALDRQCEGGHRQGGFRIRS